MSLYCGIDLHSTNSYIVVLDERDRAVVDTRVPNDLEEVLGELEPIRDTLTRVAIESTYNWYWLADGLEDHGYSVVLVNPCKAKQYDGIKYRDDAHDARWLAHMMRVGVLPTGSIMDRTQRAIRDLLRRRMRVVQQRTRNMLQLKTQIANHTGLMLSANDLKRLEPGDLAGLVDDPYTLRSIDSAIRLMAVLETEVSELQEFVVLEARKKKGFALLRSIKGVGDLLAATILYETGDIGRFPKVGNYASYCRCVRAEHRSNDKKKGEGNRRNGNPYLSWAFAQAAHFAIRFQPPVRRYFNRKKKATNARIAASTVSHKLARATYYILRDKVPYRSEMLFGASS